jgi:uncharacterized peroxidase-related enzyme
MQRIQTIEADKASDRVKDLYQEVESNLGTVPNMIRTMANSSVVAEAYVNFWNLMGQGVLPATLREQISLHVAESNGCSYCVSAHCALSKAAGLRDEEVRDGRLGHSPDVKTDTALKFVSHVLDTRGAVTTEEFTSMRDVGYTDEEITEVIALVAFVIFSNYFNNATGTVNDFPKAAELATN